MKAEAPGILFHFYRSVRTLTYHIVTTDPAKQPKLWKQSFCMQPRGQLVLVRPTWCI